MVETEKRKKVRTGKSKEVEMEAEEKRIVDTAPTGSDAASPKAEPDKEVLKSAMKKYCFIWDTSFIDLKDECELETASVINEKVIRSWKIRRTLLAMLRVSRTLLITCSRRGMCSM